MKNRAPEKEVRASSCHCEVGKMAHQGRALAEQARQFAVDPQKLCRPDVAHICNPGLATAIWEGKQENCLEASLECTHLRRAEHVLFSGAVGTGKLRNFLGVTTHSSNCSCRPRDECRLIAPRSPVTPGSVCV